MAEKRFVLDSVELEDDFSSVDMISQEEIEDYAEVWEKINSPKNRQEVFFAFSSFIKQIREQYFKYQSDKDPASPIKVDPNKSLLFHKLSFSGHGGEVENFDYQGEWSMREFVEKYSHLIEASSEENQGEKN